LPAYFWVIVFGWAIDIALDMIWDLFNRFLLIGRNDKTKLHVVKIFFIILFTLFSMQTKEFLSYKIFAYDLVMLMLPFYLLGQVIIPLIIKRNSLCVFIFLYFIFIVGTRLNGTVDIFQRQLGYWPLFWLNGLSGSLLVILISQYISKKDDMINRFGQWLGKNSLLILIVHWPIIQWLTYLLYVG
jgi:fucose 4-O-acetylase-like acetyltransferase